MQSIDALLYDTRAKIVKKTGNGVGDNIYFEATSERALDKDEVSELQMQAGYHPAGYGFYGLSSVKLNDNKGYHYNWHCSASCD